MPQSSANRIIQYAIAAVAATFANIGGQWLVIQSIGNSVWAVYASVFIGTGIGLVAKFAMDKYLIFRDPTGGRQAVTQVALYVGTGIFTTMVFWGVELLFHYLYGTDAMRYLGGILGLAIGYTLKYVLDSRFVFRTPSATHHEA